MFTCAVLFSGTATTARAILEYAGSADNVVADCCDVYHTATKPCYRINLLLCNDPSASGITTLTNLPNNQLPSMHIASSRGMTTAAWTAQIQPILDCYAPDLLVLAGFMRILDSAFLQYWRNRIINIHPSLLPAYKGLDTHQRVLDAHEQTHGFTIHMVTPELDSGPIIGFDTVQVQPTDTKESLQQRVQVHERYWYPRVIQLIANRRLKLVHDLPYLDNTPIPQQGVHLDAKDFCDDHSHAGIYFGSRIGSDTIKIDRLQS